MKKATTLDDTKQFQNDKAVQAMNATIAANVETTEAQIVITPIE